MWRDASIEGRIGPPKLVQSSWQVDVVDGSSEVAKFASPTCTLGLRVQGAPSDSAALPAERALCVELSYTTLSTLVDSMRRVRDQLAAVSAP